MVAWERRGSRHLSLDTQTLEVQEKRNSRQRRGDRHKQCHRKRDERCGILGSPRQAAHGRVR